MSRKLTFIDMFAGIGGFRSGMEQAGHKCVGFIEWDKYARQSYQAMYNTEGEFNAKDIQTVSGTDLPYADVWCFGSPCQDISLAGKQAGLEKGSRSSMFFEVIRLLKERAKHQKALPPYLLMENVKNLLSSNGGWDFARVQIEMDKAGYGVEWNVFNSAEVVPQHRERIYIVGHLRGASTRKVFPIQRESSHFSKEQSIKVIGNTSSTGYNSQNVLDSKGISSTITATQYKHPIQVGVKSIGLINGLGSYQSRNTVYSTKGVSPTLTTMQGGGTIPKIDVRAVFTPNRATGGWSQHGRRIKEPNETSFTLTTEDRHGVMLDNGTDFAIRVLTPLECWRLQGFSDKQFNKAKLSGVSNSQLYKQAGNSVTVPVIKAIAEILG